MTAYRGSPHLIDYSSTKGAIVTFTRSLSENPAKKDIRANGMAPGPIWTPPIPSTVSEQHVENYRRDAKSRPLRIDTRWYLHNFKHLGDLFQQKELSLCEHP